MRIRVFNAAEGYHGNLVFEYKASQAPIQGDSIFTDDGDWIVQQVCWNPSETKCSVSVFAQWAAA